MMKWARNWITIDHTIINHECWHLLYRARFLQRRRRVKESNICSDNKTPEIWRDLKLPAAEGRGNISRRISGRKQVDGMLNSKFKTIMFTSNSKY